MPLNDHVLLLQLERQYESVEDRLTAVELDSRDEDYCDCDCADDVNDALEAKIDHLETLVNSLEQRLAHLEAVDIEASDR